MVNKTILEIIEMFGWLSVPSKNPFMVSFIKEGVGRLNYYFSTGTVTIQSPDFEMKSWKNITTPEQMEEIVR